jgi:hypothetical protein
MTNKVHQHHSILEELDLCQPDRRKRMLDLMQCEGGLRASGANRNTFTSPETLLPSLAPLEINPNIHNWINQMVESNYAPQVTINPPRDKIIKTLIAYADNEDDPRRRNDNERYRKRIEKILETISRYICKLDRFLQEIALQDVWKQRDDLRRSHLILLLVDDNFINTDYCSCHKLEQAIMDHICDIKRVVPIYIRPCILKSDLPLVKLPFSPSIQRPISLYSNKDVAFKSIGEDIQKAAEYIRDNIL